MKLYTYTEIDTRIRKELSLETENEVTQTLMMYLINSAIDDCEAIIHDLHMDYFLTKKAYSVTTGDTKLAFPDDCFGSRMRYLYYDDGNYSYKIQKAKLEDIPDIQTSEDYRYRIVNDATNGLQINIYPNIRITSTTHFNLFYIRNAKRITATSDTIDIGEQIEYILSHVRRSLLRFYPHPVFSAIEEENFKKQEARLRSIMTTLSDDGEDSIIEMDTEIYEEHS